MTSNDEIISYSRLNQRRISNILKPNPLGNIELGYKYGNSQVERFTVIRSEENTDFQGRYIEILSSGVVATFHNFSSATAKWRVIWDCQIAFKTDLP